MFGCGECTSQPRFFSAVGREIGQRSGKCLPWAIAAILILGGVFLTLSAYQVLPQDLNVAHVWAKYVGYGTLGLGLLFAGVGSYMIYKGRQIEKPLASIASQSISEESSKAAIVDTVYINSTASGPIRHDRRFEFSKRLKTVTEEPILIKQEDIYLEIKGSKQPFVLDCDGLPCSANFLPACLFEGVKEGGKIQFYLDDKLIELTCKQHAHPNQDGASWTFEDFLKYVKTDVRLSQIQALWKEDVEGEPKFMGELIGQSLFLGDSQIENFHQYEEDQKKYGPYQRIGVIGMFANGWLFDIRSDHVQLSDIVQIESKGFNDLHQLWILIPHKPEKNRLPKDTRTFGEGNRNTRTLRREEFDPKKERFAFYHHGQYLMCPLKGSNFSLSFNEVGWLQLHLR